MKIYTYLQGLDNPPKTSKAMVKAATLIDEALKAFQACEDEGLSFREVSVGLHDLRFEMKALNNFVNRLVKPIG